MKTTKYLSLAALALMGTLASCQSDDELTIARPDNAVGINVTVGSLQATRSNPASTDPDAAHIFNQGDQVCVSTEGQDPVLFQCQNADQTWAEAVSGKFLLWTQNEMTFKAYYPATEGTSMTNFTLPADQSTEAKIALADYMTCEQTCTNVSGTDISLNLERKMARVIVRISGFGSQYRDDQKTVSNVSIYSEASGIEDGNPTGSSTEIQPYAQGNGGQGSTYTALVVPGSGDSGARFIQLTDGEGSTLLVKGIPAMQAGNSYTFNLVVGKNKIEVASVTVQDWTTGETLSGGQAQEQGGASVPITVTWNSNDITGSGLSFTKDGVTITAGNIDFDHKDFQDDGTFTTTLGNFTKIDVTTNDLNAFGTGWYGNTWTGNASSVSFSGSFLQLTKIVFTIEQGSASASVPVTAITLNKTETSIKVGSTETLSVTAVAPDNATDKTYTWNTSDETKATVDQDGKVTAVAAGTVTIYAEANDGSGVKGNCTVTVTAAPTVAEGHALSASVVGEIVGTDGNVYAVADKDNLPEGVTAVAMVAYKSATAGSSLAIALADQGSMNWNSARSSCAGKTAIGGKSWKLPTMDEWKQMFSANGGNEGSYTGLNTALSAAGGASSTLNGQYWSSSEGGEWDEGYEEAWDVDFYYVTEWSTHSKSESRRVRAVLAF